MCSFDITINGGADAFVDKARTEVTNAGGTFNGDTASGDFNVPIPFGHISGDYAISGNTVTINITHRGIISCSAIENYVKTHLS